MGVSQGVVDSTDHGDSEEDDSDEDDSEERSSRIRKDGKERAAEDAMDGRAEANFLMRLSCSGQL